MDYRFYGWENADISPVNEEFDAIGDPRQLYDILTEVWCRDTCAPRMQKDWSEEDKTLGQCSVTAFLAQDIFGGKVYGILRPGGNNHCYNVVGDCVFDLTSEQFGDEVLCYGDGVEQSRDTHFAKDEKKLRYEKLKAGVAARAKAGKKGFSCPVCGKHSFVRSGDYDICPVCGWENDPVQNRDRDFEGGANKMSLRQAKNRFLSTFTGVLVLVLTMLLLCCCNVEASQALDAVKAVEEAGKTEEPAKAEEAFEEKKEPDKVNEDSGEYEEPEKADETPAEKKLLTKVDKPAPDKGEQTKAFKAAAGVPTGEKYRFRSKKLLSGHYEKHGIEMGFGSPEEYEKAASLVAENPDSLHKTEKEDGDDVYYLEATNEFVVVSTDGYLRTYFMPDRGKSYFDRQ